MDSSKARIYKGVSTKQNKKRRRKQRSVGSKNRNIGSQISNVKESSQGRSASTTMSSSGSASLVETFTAMAQKMDLVKIRNHITELNKIFEQVNGVIQQFNQFNHQPLAPQHQNHTRPQLQRTYPPLHPYDSQPGNHQPPYHSGHGRVNQ